MTAYDYIQQLYVSGDVTGVLSKQFILVIRGIPGSGKTTLATKLQRLLGYPELVSADDYFTKGEDYNFVQSKLSSAHAYATAKMDHAMFHERSVILHNTSTRAWELQQVTVLADEYRVPMLVIDLKTEFKNIHGVPDDKVLMMKSRFESCLDLPLPRGTMRSTPICEAEFDSVLFTPYGV